VLSAKPEPSSPGEVIKLSDDDEPENVTPLVVATPATPIVSAAPAILIVSIASNIPGPSIPRAVGLLDMSRDEEIARKLYIKLNRGALGILGDRGLVILSSDDEEDVIEERRSTRRRRRRTSPRAVANCRRRARLLPSLHQVPKELGDDRG
jgi:hypothetical protein